MSIAGSDAPVSSMRRGPRFLKDYGMTPNDTPAAMPAPSAHVLARELAARITPAFAPNDRVLMLGIGRGRNVAPFARANVALDIVEADDGRAREAAATFASDPSVHVACATYAGPYPFPRGHGAALSTHALLHADLPGVARALAAIARALRASAPFYATFGSTNDPRYGAGTCIDAATYAPPDGPEAGVAHVYFDERRLRAALGAFAIESLEEVDAAEHVGRWAHDEQDAARIVHWFVRATVR